MALKQILPNLKPTVFSKANGQTIDILHKELGKVTSMTHYECYTKT